MTGKGHHRQSGLATMLADHADHTVRMALAAWARLKSPSPVAEDDTGTGPEAMRGDAIDAERLRALALSAGMPEGGCPPGDGFMEIATRSEEKPRHDACEREP